MVISRLQRPKSFSNWGVPRVARAAATASATADTAARGPLECVETRIKLSYGNSSKMPADAAESGDGERRERGGRDARAFVSPDAIQAAALDSAALMEAAPVLPPVTKTSAPIDKELPEGKIRASAALGRYAGGGRTIIVGQSL